MSFFSNPLAEEDEVLPPDYPLEQYDERKREDDFNELLVRSTKLETEQHSINEASAMQNPELVQCLKQNQQIRAALEEMWSDISDEDKRRRSDFILSSSSELLTATSNCSSSMLNSALDTVSAQMHAQAVQQEAAASSLKQLVKKAAARLRSKLAADQSPTESPTASAFTTLQTANSVTVTSHTASLGANAASERPAVNAAEVEAAVQMLEAHLPCMCAEEAALAAAAVQHLHYGLCSWMALLQRHAVLRRSVAAKSQEQAEAQQAVKTFARWLASRQLASEQADQRNDHINKIPSAPQAASGSSVISAAPSLSFDLAVAELLNKQINEENWRLEAVLSRLLTNGQGASGSSSASPPSFAGSALVHRISLLDHARELDAEIERLGSAVLYLRNVLTNPTSYTKERLMRALSSPSDSEVYATPDSTARETVWAARLTHLSALETSLRSSVTSPSSSLNLEIASGSDSSADTILLHGLTKLLELHDACLHTVALLSTYFERQSASATFLVRAMRGGGSLDDATMERVLDVSLPDAATVQQTFEDVATTCADVAREIAEQVQRAAVASAAALERWESVRTALLHLLRESVELVSQQHQRQHCKQNTYQADGADGNHDVDREIDDPNNDDEIDVAALLMAYAERERLSVTPDTPVADCVRAEPCWATALQEEVETFKEEKAARHAQVKEYWLNQQAEANKKLSWLMKQPNARLLLDLCATEKEREELTQRLKVVSDASADACALQHTLNDLQRQVTEETLHNALLQEERAKAQERKRDLENERANLIASLS